MQFSDWLAARAKATPWATAVTINTQQWNYAELDQLVNVVAGQLTPYVQPGAKVSVLLPNNLLYVCLIHALARLGAVLVPLNTRLTTPELIWQLDLTACKLLIFGAETAEIAQMLTGNGRKLLDSTNWTLTLTTEHEDRGFMVGHGQETGPERHIFETDHEQNKFAFSLDNLQAIIFTSGTTGQPKGAMLTFANHFWSAAASAFRLGLQTNDMWLSCLPLYHVGGLAVVFRSCLYGTAVDLHGRFDLEAINYALDHKPISMISLVPTMLQRLLATRDFWPASLRLILLGGAAAPAELVQQANALPRRDIHNTQNNSQPSMPIVATTYGLTEAGSQVATMLPDEVQHKPGSVGKPLLFTQVHIQDNNGHTLPAREIGEVIVSGPTVMTGYTNNAEATAVALRNDQLHTGDIGYLDKDGDLWLIQRRSDIIVSGGENVYPAEVEQVLRQHPAIEAVAVVGTPHPEWGQQVAAVIVLRTGAELTPADVEEYGRKKLAGYKIPRLIHFVDQLPQTASGKIQRQQVAQIMANIHKFR